MALLNFYFFTTDADTISLSGNPQPVTRWNPPLQILELSDTTYEIQYLFFFVFLLISISFIFMCLNFIFGYRATLQGDKEKLSPYECGFDPFENARIKYNVHFFLVGLLYLLFDLEIIFLLPWVFAAGLLQSFTSFLVVLTFIGLLVLGFWYEWVKHALDW